MKKKKIGKNGFILAGILLAVIILIALLSAKSTTSVKTIEHLSDLDGMTVGVQSGTLYEKGLEEKVPGAKIVYYSDPYSMLLSVEQGKLDAALDESTSFKIEQKEHPSLVMLDESTETDQIVVGFGKTDRQNQLCAEFNEFIAKCNEDGTLEEMRKYWFDNYSEECTVDKSGITGENGKIRVAVETTYEPFEYIVAGEYQGFDIDVVYQFAKEYGYEPVIEGLDFDAISPALATGKYDMGMNLGEDDERADVLLFSEPYTQYDINVVYVGGEAESGNIIDSIQDSFYKTFIYDNRWQQLAEGLGTTVLIAALSIIIGFVLGTLAYMLCYENDWLANGIMNVLCEVFGGLPSVVLLMIMYYIVFGNLNASNILVSVLTFSIMFTCSVFSIIRSGVTALGEGQYEAARAQGLSSTVTFLKIIYPQVLLNRISTLEDEMGSLVKETAIVGYIAVVDLTKASDIIRGRTFEPFFPLIVTAIIYYLFIKLLIAVLSMLMSNIKPGTRNAEKILKRATQTVKR